MRKMIMMISLVLAMMLCAVNCPAETVTQLNDTASQPLLYLDFVPDIGVNKNIEGHIAMPDGSTFDCEEYRISLYLQVTPNDQTWVKPTYAVPYVDIGADGKFSGCFITGGSDISAQVLHVLLIPASYLPTEDIDETINVALDYAVITRTQDGEYAVVWTRAEHEAEGTDAGDTDADAGSTDPDEGVELRITNVPVYGSKGKFKGVVTAEQGVDLTQYRVSLYVQLDEGGQCYVKPYANQTFSSVAADGSFAITYATGGDDIHAKIIHIMLIPASYTPGESIDDTIAQAIRYTKVTRDADGSTNVGVVW